MAEPVASQKAYLQDLMSRSLEMGPIYLPHRFQSMGGVFYSTAHIANDLGPLFRTKIQADSEIRIIGYDGFSLAKEDYPWRQELVDWVNRGGRLRYLLQKPLDTTRAAVAAIHRQIQDPYMLRVRHFGGCEEFSGLAQEWESFHFALLSQPDMLWVETNHPAGQTQAEDCYFFEDVTKLGSYPVLKAQFDRVFEEAKDL